MKQLRGNLYIPSVEAKDIYLGNIKFHKSDGSVNYGRFINSFDYSLDLIELREVAKTALPRGEKLSFINNMKEYSDKIINVTFKYSVREFNKVSKNLYVRQGHHINEGDLTNGLLIEQGELIAIKTETPYYEVGDTTLLPDWFCCDFKAEDMTYTYRVSGKAIKTVETSSDLRHLLYSDGFDYNGIHYRRFKRSSGSARVGKCLFIDERLYPAMHKAEQCGLDYKEGDEFDLAAFEAYISLPTSSIIDTVEISPKNILLIEDFESTFKEVAVCTSLDDTGESIVTEEKEMEITNSIWDGQSLIDSSLMGEYSDRGMLLLRNKFFKSCCFNTNIREFFADHNITDISQLNGKTLATDISDIKLITTPSSIKLLKFGSFEQWCDNIYPFFGIVKYDKDTHFFDGKYVQTHYQLINTLQLSEEEAKELVQEGLDYLSLLNTDVDVMRFHLKFKADENIRETNIMMNTNEIVYNLLNYNCGFEQTKVYHDFKLQLRRSYLNNMKKGHLLVDGTYATLCGNPYEMLLSSIGAFDGNSVIPVGSVINTRYADGEALLGSRSPHVACGNILLVKNLHLDVVLKYFNLTNNIVCVNSINENTLERLSGADFDSDTMLITNNKILVQSAKKNYEYFKVPNRNINPPKTKRCYTAEELTDVDIKSSKNKIGEIINLSQELNSLFWHKFNKSKKTMSEMWDELKDIYYDCCTLDVLSNIEIDKTKKEYPLDTAKELNKIRDKYKDELTVKDGKKKMPKFLGFIAQTKHY